MDDKAPVISGAFFISCFPFLGLAGRDGFTALYDFGSGPFTSSFGDLPRARSTLCNIFMQSQTQYFVLGFLRMETGKVCVEFQPAELALFVQEQVSVLLNEHGDQRVVAIKNSHVIAPSILVVGHVFPENRFYFYTIKRGLSLYF